MANNELIVHKLLEQENEEYTYAKNNLKALIEAGMVSLVELQDIASTSQHPRAFETLAGLMQTLVDANMRLMDAKEKDTKINIAKGKASGIGGPEKIENKFIFKGTTADLQNFLSNQRKKNE